MVPDTISKALPLVSCQHGTVTLKSDVPSNLNEEALLGLAFAATGYAATMPDYLGLGDSAGLHPYHHTATEAGVVIDLLRAARVFCATNDVPLNGQLFLAGYSQGGHSTMAAFKELEQNYSHEFTVTAAAPMAGAYDLSGTMLNDFLSDRVMPSPYYIAYLMMAYREAYAWTNALDTVLLSKYATQLPGYFDGNHSGGQIDSLVPSQPKKMFQPAFLDSMRTNAANEFRVALAANDVYQWTPKAPTRLYHCLGDQDVPFANSQVALDYFHSHGAPQVELIDPNPALDHGGGVMPCLLSAKAWFDSLKQ
jgi:pimeloyl-ACP methyl ester carboxylesterase